MQYHENSLELILDLQSGSVKQTKCGAAYVFEHLTAVILRAVDGFPSANILFLQIKGWANKYPYLYIQNACAWVLVFT